MIRIFSFLTVILAIVLFPPAALAFISNNAVPGDRTYPIKRSLEGVILTVVSVHPFSKAWFSVERSNRRFDESITLITEKKNDKVEPTLKELVAQTRDAANEIISIKDPVVKKEKIKDLRENIQKYDEKLKEIEQELQSQGAAEPPSQQVSPTPSPTLAPSPTQTQVVITPAPTRAVSPAPTLIPSPTVQPTPTIPAVPTPSPVPTQPAILRPIEDSRGELDDIDSGLEEEQGRLRVSADLSPSPSPSPSSSPSPSGGLLITPGGGEIIRVSPRPTSSPTEAPSPTPVIIYANPTPIEILEAPTTPPEPISCSVCQADVYPNGVVDNTDMIILEDGCARLNTLRGGSNFDQYCQKMDINSDDRIDTFEISCARGKLGQICVQ